MLYRRDADRGIEPLSASDRQRRAACTLKQDNSSAGPHCMEGANLGTGLEDRRPRRARGWGWSVGGLLGRVGGVRICFARHGGSGLLDSTTTRRATPESP